MFYEYPILTDPLAAYNNRRTWFIEMVKHAVETITAGAKPNPIGKTTYWQQGEACRSTFTGHGKELAYECWMLRYTIGDQQPEGMDETEWAYFTHHLQKFCKREDGGLYIVSVYQYQTPEKPYVIWPFEVEVPALLGIL